MLAIKCGSIIKPDGSVGKNETLLIEGERILAVGAHIDIPREAEIYDAADMFVSPGIIEAHCHLGMDEGDINELSSPITADCNIKDSFFPRTQYLPEMRASGITAACVLPGSTNLIGGLAWTLKFRQGNTVAELDANVPQPVKLALGENPSYLNGKLFKRAPATRMANAALLRRTFIEAGEYMRDLERGNIEHRNAGLEALIPLLKGEAPARIHAHRADDMVTGVELSREFGFRAVIEHSDEAYTILDYLVKNNVVHGCAVLNGLMR